MENSTQNTICLTAEEVFAMACDTWEAREIIWKREKTELMEALRIMLTETALCVKDQDSEAKIKRAMQIYAKYESDKFGDSIG